MLAPGGFDQLDEAVVVHAALRHNAVGAGVDGMRALFFVFLVQQEDHRAESRAAGELPQPHHAVAIVGRSRQQYRIVALGEELHRQRSALQRRVRADLRLGPLAAHVMTDQRPDLRILLHQQ